MANIETGVDKLVKLVAKERKIELSEAAKQLGVSSTVVQEWADFLEQEGLIDVQYSLSKVFLAEKRLSQADVEKKGKEYENKKEAFVRKVDSTLKQLENETADFESIKTQYYALKDQIGDEIDEVKDEIEQLRHYEDLKKSIDQDILRQKVDYQKTLDDVHLRVLSEEKRYAKIFDDIGVENEKLKAERNEFADIKREEGELLKRIDALQDIMKSVTSRLQSQSQAVGLHEERLQRLRELAEKLQLEIGEKKTKEIEPLLKISKDQEQRILRIQDEIVNKVKAQRDKVQVFQGQSEEVAKHFEVFFEKRARTEATIKELEKAKAEMKSELSELVDKARAYDIAAKGADTNAHIKVLEAKFQEFDKKRGLFAEQIEKLKNIIMGKTEESPATQPAKQIAAKETTTKGAKKDVKTKPSSKSPLKPVVKPVVHAKKKK